jgi:uncharacterized membrane protein YcjF (UPF0283 family)
MRVRKTMTAEQLSEQDPDNDPDPAAIPIDPRETARFRSGGIVLLATGVALLIAGLLIVQFALLIDQLISRSPWLGSLAAVVFILALALCAVGIWREIAGLFSLKSNQWWREELSDPDTDLESRKRIAAKWLRLLELPRTTTVETAGRVQSADSSDHLDELLRDRIVSLLDKEVRRRSQKAAYQAAAAKLLIDSPVLESLVFLFFTLRLLRQIGVLHGLRPGLVASLLLYRRVLLDSALLLGVDVVADATVDMAASNKIVELLGSRGPGAGVAYLRIRRFGRVAALACCPLPPETRSTAIAGAARVAVRAVRTAASSVRSGHSKSKKVLRSMMERVFLRPKRARKAA